MESVTGRPWQILIVDDDEDDFIIISEMIQGLWKDCVNVHWHPHPDGVIDKICSEQFEVSIIDSHLNGSTGLELIKHIKTKCPKEIILFLSAWPDQNLRNEVLQLGANCYIDKNTVTAENLTEEIKRAIMSL